ncbi:hypothetical protein AVEN_106531-1 [Araneus ventricosus]|uniref:Uncharacterized protein n=1 Tax=Araneus ventricosus TaxID=182803 RepID=A0A4Y2G3C4_ARAVE|nr:hypothetical protein AVEN_106531-1 [Araneus ventricosus]
MVQIQFQGSTADEISRTNFEESLLEDAQMIVWEIFEEFIRNCRRLGDVSCVFKVSSRNHIFLRSALSSWKVLEKVVKMQDLADIRGIQRILYADVSEIYCV